MRHPSRSAASWVAPLGALATLVIALVLVPVWTTTGRPPIVSAQSTASVLASTADAMAPDTWAVLNTNGISSTTLIEPGFSSDNITSDASRGCWDTVQQRAHFTGQDHTSGTTPMRHVVYDAATNTWIRMADPPFGGSADGTVSHNWNYQACDPRGRTMYRGRIGTLNVWRYNFDTQTWTSMGKPPDTVMAYPDGFAGFSFNPDRGASGQLMIAGLESGTSGLLIRYDVATNSWARVTPSLLAGFPSPYSFSDYSPTYKAVFFGNSTTARTLFSGTSDTVTQAPTTPCEAGENRQGIVHADPATGNFVLLCGPSTASWFIFNPSTNTWATKPTPSSITNHILNFPTGGPNNPTWGAIGIPILDHGVIMYVKCNQTSCGVRLYKGGAFTAGVSPAAPTGLTAR